MCVCMYAQSFSDVQLFATPWTVACLAPLSMEFSRQEYWSGLPFPSLGDHLDPGVKLTSLASLALAGGFFTTASPGKSYQVTYMLIIFAIRKSFSYNSNLRSPLGIKAERSPEWKKKMCIFSSMSLTLALKRYCF